MRDRYVHLEKYLEKAPPEVMQELELLRHKIEDGLRQAEQRGRNKFARMF